MKKIVVISDSHGNTDAINKIFEDNDFDYLFFLGDGIADLGIYVNDERVRLVRGNCDFFSDEKRDCFVVVEKVVFFLTHGDKYSTKSTLRYLYNSVKDLNPKVVCFGHNHKWYKELIGDIIFLNPGSLGKGKDETYAKVIVDGEDIRVEKCSFN